MGVRENIKDTISLYRDMNIARPRLVYDTKAEFINWNTTGINKGADKDIIKLEKDVKEVIHYYLEIDLIY